VIERSSDFRIAFTTSRTLEYYYNLICTHFQNRVPDVRPFLFLKFGFSFRSVLFLAFLLYVVVNVASRLSSVGKISSALCLLCCRHPEYGPLFFNEKGSIELIRFQVGKGVEVKYSSSSLVDDKYSIKFFCYISLQNCFRS